MTKQKGHYNIAFMFKLETGIIEIIEMKGIKYKTYSDVITTSAGVLERSNDKFLAVIVYNKDRQYIINRARVMRELIKLALQ